jgi:hypothetical protein
MLVYLSRINLSDNVETDFYLYVMCWVFYLMNQLLRWDLKLFKMVSLNNKKKFHTSYDLNLNMKSHTRKRHSDLNFLS